MAVIGVLGGLWALPCGAADGWVAPQQAILRTSATEPAAPAGAPQAPPATFVLPTPPAEASAAPVAPANAVTAPGARSVPAAASSAPAAAVGPAAPGPVRPAARVVDGKVTLPSDQGQIWREYDITPYTLRVTTTNRPEQAIVDWVLRETGYEVWHSDPLGVLSANRRTLRVYHTPQVQHVVAEIVDRFVASQAASHVFGLRIVSVDQPNWRSRVQQGLRPVAAQTPGVQAWLMEKEDAAMLLADLRRRSDFREHGSPHLLLNSGQSTVVSSTRARPYVRDVTVRADAWPGFDSQPAQIDEGFSLEFSPLLSIDGRVVDATVKCDVDQVEKLIPVVLDTPTANAPRQRTQIEVPQIVRARILERFRWPVEQVLLVGLGMVPMPTPTDAKPLLPGLTLGTPAARSDLLLLIESKGEAATQAQGASPARAREARTYHGRY